MLIIGVTSSPPIVALVIKLLFNTELIVRPDIGLSSKANNSDGDSTDASCVIVISRFLIIS